MEIRINLLPLYKKEEIAHAKHLGLVLRLQLGIIFIGLVFLLFLLAIEHILDLNFEAVSRVFQTSANQENRQKIDQYDKIFSEANLRVSEVIKIRRDQLSWSQILLTIEKNILPGISVGELSTKDYAVFISGKASNRDDLISFRDRLSESGCFSQVELPLSNLVSKDDVAFQMDLKVKPECLKR